MEMDYVNQKPKGPKFQRKKKHSVKGLVIALCSAALVLGLIAAGLVLLPTITDPHGNRILDGVTVAGVDVSGMKKSEAVKAVEEAIGTVFAENDMVLVLPDKTFTFSPKETGVKLNAKAAVKQAFRYGREEDAADTVTMLESLDIKESVIRDALNDYASSFETEYTPASYTLAGEMPELDPEFFNEKAPCQVLQLSTGTSGLALDLDEVFDKVMDAYNRQSFQVKIGGKTLRQPAPLDLGKVAEEICIDPVEPQVNMTDFSIIPGWRGYSFDMETAQAMLDKAGEGETVEIPMEYVDFTLQGDEVYFQDTLGYCKTPHGNNENRNGNLRKACGILDGLVIQPGEEISYNELLGERTKDNGWLPAPAYSGTRLIDSPGGGICQVSSTLYLASLYAELTTLERVNHGYPVSYIPVGLDATVNWGTTDLKLRNDYPFPVKLLCQESDGYVHIRIMGTETRDYYVKMEYHAGGRYSTSYRCRYDRETDEQIYREVDHRSAYLDDVQSIMGWIGSDVWVEPETVTEETP